MATNPGVDCVTDGLLSQQSSSNKTMDDKTVFIVALGSALFVVTLIAFILLGWVVHLKRTIREMPHVKEEVFLVPNPALRTDQNIEISPPLPSSLSDIQSLPPNDQEQSATSNSLNSHLTDLPTRSSDSTESPNSMAAPLDDPPQRASLSLDPPDFPPEPSQSSFSLSRTTRPDKGTDPATHVPRFRKRSASLDLNSSPRVLPHGNVTIPSIKIPIDSIPPETSTRQLGDSYSSKPRKDNSPIGVSWRDQSPIPSVELPLEDIPSAIDGHTDTLPSPSAGSDCGPFRMFWRDQSPIPSVEIPLDDIPSASDTHANTLPSANAGSDSGRFRMFSRDPSPILSVVLPLDDTPPARPTHDSPMSLLAVPKRRFALPSTLSDSSPAQQHSKQTAPFTQPSYLSLTSTAQNADTDLIQDGNDQSTISSVEIPQDNISSEHSGRPSSTSLSSMERGKYENPQTSLKDQRSSEAPQERISSLKSTTNGYTHVSQASRSEYMGLHACTGIQSTITSPNYPKQEDSPPSTPSKYKSISPVAESAYSDLQASPLATAHSVPTGSRSGGISCELPRRSSYTSITLTAGGESEYTGLTEDPRAHSTKRLQGEASPSTQSYYISVPSAVDNPYTSPQRATLPTDEVQRGGISSASSTGPARSYNSRLPAPNSGPLVYVLGSLLVGTVLLTIVLISVLVFQENRKTRRCETTRNSSSSTSSNSEMPGVCIERRPRPLYLTLLPPDEMGVSPESETFLCTSNAARCEDSDSASSEQQNKQPDLVAPLAEGTLTTPEQVYKVQELAACPSMQLSEGRNLKAVVHAKDYQSLGPTDATEYTSPYKLKPKEESSAEKPRFHRSYQVNYEGMDKATIFTKTQYTTYRV